MWRVCPDWFCVKACSRRLFDNPIQISAVQATIIQKAKDLKVMPEFKKAQPNGKKIAIIGAGVAELSATGVLTQIGYRVYLFDKNTEKGGVANIIPDYRLSKKVLKSDIEFIRKLGDIKFIKSEIKDPKQLLLNYDSVIVAAGVHKQIRLNIKNEDKAIDGLDFLRKLKKLNLKSKKLP